MEDNWQGHDPREDRAAGSIGDPVDPFGDDPLGDEAAFPSTWQHLASAESGRLD